MAKKRYRIWFERRTEHCIEVSGDDLPPEIIYTSRAHGWSTTKLKDLITKQTIKQNPDILK